ncbi:pyruvate formate-lyase-activating protein [Selenomonas flueggei]|uniref:Pyruvate formate-lyase-activating enzyme n=1 Tax=Selenomonas flueggei ATCC 43531 TaxID=638302 RepID=C4V4V1_9FIRM|nr:pyruvate formate-lyase-activating protein [Selenomonas flueggei]EEQ48198.1 pyruvate formate-lyase 1-activating enzyme [Selenomonas flueggei ATCC 43531]
MSICKGRISTTESFGSVDGPGIRFIVFVQGCRYRCQYCHNPETWEREGGYEATAEEIFRQAWRYRPYWKRTGGITVSGGEPLLQLEFVTELFRLAKEKGVNTVIDTAGEPFTYDEPFFSAFETLLPLSDLFLLDLKQIDDAKHRALTGTSNESALALAQFLSERGKRMWIRHVLVPGWTTGEEDLRRLSAFIAGLKTVDRVEVLPYHAMARHKYEELRLPYRLGDTPAPTAEEIARAEEILRVGEYRGYLR